MKKSIINNKYQFYNPYPFLTLLINFMMYHGVRGMLKINIDTLFGIKKMKGNYKEIMESDNQELKQIYPNYVKDTFQ